ncbi:putative metal dependent phosphohydrolase [Candidatus Nitrososphaera gargensis Ga9.2]|uniref:Putative metal dependent phosphohydrolase n=1 Tax=Nitrososphaera gargensis (strain Ga9.2) TaxID=1237085 RepID=K0INS4_NITGG|nr:HD domain-containing protein [Candidatus Nitrososphaera gargensis]AFU59879.1 putative metal dependent phosphohydrolase [Candidatus Nitrososphaera gargensis Ga9.2]
MLDKIKKRVKKALEGRDPAHDFQHIMRVYKNAEIIGRCEGADLTILLPAALLHDLVVYPKGSAKTSKSADDSADLAEKWLQRYGYPHDKIDKICYCIRTHSYSKRLVPSTLEGKILQDADRLDALGAIGIARTFSVGGTENRAFYNPSDPFWKTKRELNDREWTLDHFQTKLLKLKKSMHTKTAQEIAQERAKFMELFIGQMQKEIF